jgi:hypothetical protein
MRETGVSTQGNKTGDINKKYLNREERSQIIFICK